MIRVDDLHMHFGGIRAVDGASIEIKEVVSTWTVRTSPDWSRISFLKKGCSARFKLPMNFPP